MKIPYTTCPWSPSTGTNKHVLLASVQGSSGSGGPSPSSAAEAEAEGQAYPQHGDLQGVGLATAQSHPPPQVLDGDDDS